MGKPPQCLIKQVPQASQLRLRILSSAIFSLIVSFSQRTSLYLPQSIRRRDFRGTRCRGDSWAVDFCQSGEPGTLVEQKAAHCDQTRCLMASLQASWWWFLIEGGDIIQNLNCLVLYKSSIEFILVYSTGRGWIMGLCPCLGYCLGFSNCSKLWSAKCMNLKLPILPLQDWVFFYLGWWNGEFISSEGTNMYMHVCMYVCMHMHTSVYLILPNYDHTPR